MSSPTRRDRPGPAWLQVAIYQIAAVLGAFLLAGVLINLSIRNLTIEEVRARVLGEVGTLDDEVVQKGAEHLFHTVDKRSHQARGLYYRLESRDGAQVAGLLRQHQTTDGWNMSIAPDIGGRVLSWTKTLSNGARLSVGEALREEEALEAAVLQTLVVSGVIGFAFFLITSFLMQRDSWRRLTSVIRAAGDVSRGRMEVRVPTERQPARDDIDELIFAFNSMLDNIDQLVARIRQVANEVAHDMRTPLGRVRQRVERLGKTLPDNSIEQREALAVEDDLKEVLRTFDAMLRLSEFENGFDVSAMAWVDLSDLVHRVADAYRGDIEEQGRKFEVRVEPLRVHANEYLLAQAISNLLENAMRHTSAGTAIGIELIESEGHVVLSVHDKGNGVPVEHRTVVLERFRRLDVSRSGGGAGLGLAIVAAIAKCHGARLQLGDASPGLRVSLAFSCDPRRNGAIAQSKRSA